MIPSDGIAPVSAPGAQSATGDETVHKHSKPVRFSAQQKTAVVLRLLRGEALDLLSREFGVPASRLAAWRETFLAAGQESLKKHPTAEGDRELSRLREKVGESTMTIELLNAKIAQLETGRPLGRRRSRR
jgi:hypothetical protein